MTCAASKPSLAPSREAQGIVSSGGFGPLRDRILKQRSISYADYKDLREALSANTKMTQMHSEDGASNPPSA